MGVVRISRFPAALTAPSTNAGNSPLVKLLNTYLDGVEATARRLWVGVAQRRTRLLAEGPVLAVVFAGTAAITVGAILHAGVDGPGDGAAVCRADLLF